MLRIITVTITILMIFGCNRADQVSNTLHINTDDVARMNFIQSIGRFADSTFNDSSDLKLIVDFKLMDTQGNIQTTDIEGAIDSYYNISLEKSDRNYVIFELKKADKAILLFEGKGLWGNISAQVLVDKKSKTIEKIAFDHQQETPGVGANFVEPKFKDQFINVDISDLAETFGLNQNGEEILPGRYKVDGVSSATMTSRGAVEMINKGLDIYGDYLDFSKETGAP